MKRDGWFLSVVMLLAGTALFAQQPLHLLQQPPEVGGGGGELGGDVLGGVGGAVLGLGGVLALRGEVVLGQPQLTQPGEGPHHLGGREYPRNNGK